MNRETGEIKDEAKLTQAEKKSGKWMKLPAELANKLLGMSRQKRKAYMEQNYRGNTPSWNGLPNRPSAKTMRRRAITTPAV